MTALAAAVPQDYAVSLVVDHAALVTAGSSRSDGADLRIACLAGATWVEHSRVLDSSSSFGGASTALWYRHPAALAAGASDSSCYLYYGYGAASAAPANRSDIFLHWDDFESGSLSRWSVLSGSWTISTAQAHGGTSSLAHGEETTTDRVIVANPPLSVADVYFDAWWRRSGRSVDVSQTVRLSPDAGHNYQANIESMAGWCIAKRLNGTWSKLTANQAEPAVDTWVRLGVAISGTHVRVFQNGVQINPTGTASFDVGSELSRGSIGLEKYNVGTGQSVWVDDITARPYVDPEPFTLLGPQE